MYSESGQHIKGFIIGLLCWISKASRILLLPSCPPLQGSLLLANNGVCSLLDMYDNSILGILVLHYPPVLCHVDFQCPPGLTNIGS